MSVWNNAMYSSIVLYPCFLSAISIVLKSFFYNGIDALNLLKYSSDQFLFNTQRILSPTYGKTTTTH